MRVAPSAGLMAAAVAGVAAATVGARPGLVASPDTWRTQLATDPTGAVGLAATTLLWLLLGLIALGLAATVLARLPGTLGAISEAVSRRLLPTALRRGVHLMIGVTVGVTALAPVGASAAPGSGAQVAVAPTSARPVVTLPTPLPELGEPAGSVSLPTAHSPLPQVANAPATTGPDPALATALTALPTPKPTPKPAPEPVRTGAGGALVVVPGDSLWAMAARELAAQDAGRTPRAGSIADEWPRWWAANRAVIGADPDLLLPGERLRPPA